MASQKTYTVNTPLSTADSKLEKVTATECEVSACGALIFRNGASDVVRVFAPQFWEAVVLDGQRSGY